MRWFAALFLVILSTPALAQEIATIEIEPGRVEATVGDTVQVRATAYTADGQVAEVPIQWLTSYEVGTIDSTGAFMADQAGERSIIAVAGQATESVVAVVNPLPAARLEPQVPASVTATSWVPLAARAFDRRDERVFDAPIQWSASDPAVAEITGNYLVARAPGAVSVRAQSGSASATAELTVTAAPEGDLSVRAPVGELLTGEVHRLEPTIGGQALSEGMFPRYTVTGPGGTIEPDGAFYADEPGEYVAIVDFAGQTATAPIRVEARSFDKKLEFVGRGAVSYAHTGDLWIFEDVAYVGNYGDNSMRVFDISDPTNPVMTDSIVVDARRVNDVKVNVEAGYAITTREGASDRKNGIVVLDISDPRHPTITSEYTETVSGGVHNVFLVGELVYAVHNGTSDMHIIDVSDRENPVEVGRWGLDKHNKVLHDVFIKDGIAYLSYWDDGLVILDLGGAGKGGTPNEPQFVSRIHYPGGNTHVAWRWKDYVFLGDEHFPADWDPDKPIAASGFIHVVDVSDIENPVEVAKYEVPEAGAHNVWVEDDEDTLYIGYYQAGVRTVDISGELRGDLYRQGRQIDAFITQDDENVKVPNAPFNWGVMIYEGKIYSVDFNSGLWILEWVPVDEEEEIASVR